MYGVCSGPDLFLNAVCGCVNVCVCLRVCVYGSGLALTLTPCVLSQRSWSGDKFTNKEWALKHGEGKAYIK